jgi:hypothetical protein
MDCGVTQRAMNRFVASPIVPRSTWIALRLRAHTALQRIYRAQRIQPFCNAFVLFPRGAAARDPANCALQRI